MPPPALSPLTPPTSLNGTQISAKGENYTLANGQTVPASITYTDDKGGGTTYLPIRRIAELLGVETGWDGTTGSVTVKGEVKTPTNPTTTPDTTVSTDYSDWSKEDEAVYQEFKGMWEVKRTEVTPNNEILYDAKYLGNLGKTDFIAYWAVIPDLNKEKFSNRLSKEYQLKNPAYSLVLYFQYQSTDLGYAFSYEDNSALSHFTVNPFNIHEIIND